MDKIIAVKEIRNILKGDEERRAGEGHYNKSSQHSQYGEWAMVNSYSVLPCICILVSYTGMCEMIQ